MKTNIKNKNVFVQKVFNQVFDKYDLMNDIMSVTAHRLWKKQLVSWLSPSKNKKILDMACGTGDIVKLLIEYTNNNCFVHAVDPNAKMIDIAKNKIGQNRNIIWNTGKAEKLKYKDNTFDYYTISFGIRNVSDINKALKEAHRVLKPGGRFMCLEFSKIQNNYLNKLYQLYTKNIPKIGKIVVGSDISYKYLIKSIKNFYNQDELIVLMKENDFFNTEFRNINNGIVAIHSGWKI